MTNDKSKALAQIDPSYPAQVPQSTGIVQRGDTFAGASEKKATDRQREILCAKVDPASVRILPDTGSLYLDWRWYADRLTDAFGPMGWSLLPTVDSSNNPNPPMIKDDVAYREFFLKVEGRFVGSALGECGYKPTNKRMTFGDAVEGAKSNSLSRCCKVLSMARELYDEAWREAWLAQYAVAVHVGADKVHWRKATAQPFRDEGRHARICPCAECRKSGGTQAKQPAKKADAAPFIAVITAVSKSPKPASGGQHWYTIGYAVDGKHSTCSTFSESDADLALSCSRKKQSAMIALIEKRDPQTGQVYYNLKSIEPIVEQS